MSAVISRKFSALLITLATVCTAYAQEEPAVFDGRVYEIVFANGISWDAANAAANSMVYDGIQGHLATLTTAEEDEFVRQLAVSEGANKELWVGGFQLDGSTEPGEGWLWINGTPIAPTNTDDPYTNWNAGEPNDLGTELHLGIGLGGFGPDQYGWNDEQALGNIGGYVVEYGDSVEVDVNECASGGDGCDLGGVTALFPPEANIDPDATLTVQSFRFDGDDGRCGQQSLELFDGAVTLPAYLCGSPDFIVLKTESEGISIPEGTVFVENETETLLPGNLFICEDPIVQDFPNGVGDPQDQDVVAWQATDRTEMLENTFGAGQTAGGVSLAGSVAEVTDSCGSSRGRTRTNSYYFIGLHIDFGDANDWLVNQAGNFDSFVALTRYKIVLLREAIIRARNDDAISYRDYRYMLRDVGSALRSLDGGNYAGALARIQTFIARVGTTTYDTSLPFNHNGEHLMRSSNIEFMLDVKVIPYAP